MASLQVATKELSSALHQLHRHGGKHGGEIVLAYSEGLLELHYGGVTTSVKAAGDWPGRARIQPNHILGIRSLLPREDVLTLAAEADGLRVGATTLPCSWDEMQLDIIPTALNADRLDLLMLALECSHEQIDASGLGKPVMDARRWRDEIAHRAAHVLAPLGVEAIDVERLIDTVLRRRTSKPLPPPAVQ